jgi:SAM-dependent methyltransferase
MPNNELTDVLRSEGSVGAMGLSGYRDTWDDLARLDPYWAILSHPERRFGRWDESAFFATGEQYITGLLENAARLGYPMRHEAALDFGCGVGRLTRALAQHFEHVTGVDVSTSMVAQAKHLNSAYTTCQFVRNTEHDLRLFADNTFDLVQTFIVLQHIPSRRIIMRYIAEFLRVARPGGLIVFDLPNYKTLRQRIQAKARLYSLLRRVGVSERFLYQRLHINPVRMSFIPEPDILRHIRKLGGRVLDVQRPGEHTSVYYLTK